MRYYKKNYNRNSSKRSNRFENSLIIFLFALSIFLSILGTIGIVLCVLSCALAIIFLVQYILERKEERRKLYMAVQTPEPQMIHHQAKRLVTNASPEEIRLYKALSEFLAAYDVYSYEKEKLSWMYERFEAQTQLKMQTDFSEESFQKQKKLVTQKEANCRLKAFSFPKDLCPQRPLHLFQKLGETLPSPKTPLLSLFFAGAPVYAILQKGKETAYLTPSYLLFFDENSFSFSIEKYEQLSFETEIIREKKTGPFKDSDEIAFTTWEHERKDGGPDLRYRENHSTTYLYRGKMILSCKENRWVLEFPNKTTVEHFAQSLKEFLEAKPEVVRSTKKEKTSVLPKTITADSRQDNENTPEAEVPQIENLEARIPSPSQKNLDSKTVFQKAYTAQELEEKYRYFLSPGTTLYHRTFGPGVLTRIEKSKGYFYVQFGSEEKRFLYPNAIQQGYFTIR